MSKPDPADLQHLRDAIRLSEEARRRGNMPYGAVLVAADGEVLARTGNSIVTDCDVTAHAETNAFRAASRLGAERLAGATMYASGEPCPMCSGAIIRLGVRRVLFGISAAEAMPYMPAATGVMPGSVACRDLLALAPQPIEVHGPLLEEEARVPFEALRARGAA
ncbi:MAG: nucleoside deaminase [Burkholderiales bacterium]